MFYHLKAVERRVWKKFAFDEILTDFLFHKILSFAYCSKAIKAIVNNRLYNPTTGVSDEITQVNLK